MQELRRVKSGVTSENENLVTLHDVVSVFRLILSLQTMDFVL